MRVAAVDVGTNTTRLLVARYLPLDLFAGPRLEWLDRRVTVTRLGAGVDETGMLADDAVARTVAVLAGYGEAIRAWEVDDLRAVATSATRDAANRDLFLERAELALGARPHVISGAEEASLSFRGATVAGDVTFPAVVIDPGGGSTEFVMGSNEVEYVESVDIGSVRLTERHLEARPVSDSQLDAARSHVAELLARVHLPQRPETAVGVAGTFTSLAAMALELARYDPAVVHGTDLAVDRISGLVRRLAAMTVAETAAIPSLDPGRAPVILGGALVAEGALKTLGLGGVVISESDLLDGVALTLGEKAG